MMRGALIVGLALLLSAALPFPALAQLATLVADNVAITGDDEITATGNVEMSFEGSRLTAQEVRYNQRTQSLEIVGPLVLTQDGRTVLFADAAELDSDFRNGILRSARLVLDEQMQLAANEIGVVDGRYTQLTRVVTSTCRVCDASETPLWEIRAKSVIHDNVENQIYFNDAQFRLFGVPVLYAPRLRLPDPSLSRATGVLAPSIEFQTQLGTGIKVPYFVVLGDHADLTFTPYVSSETLTLETRYRQELSYGSFEVEGAGSFDSINDNTLRGYLNFDGTFRLPNDYKLRTEFWYVSDDNYLRDYGISDADRLESSVEISRTKRDEDFRTSAAAFRTLRFPSEPLTNQLPENVVDLSYRKRLAGNPTWGEIWSTIDAQSVVRPSDTDTFGRDTARVTGAVDWQHGFTLPAGIVARADAGLVIDVTNVRQDPDFDDATTRATPRAALELRWPFAKTEASGARQVIEPVAQLVWAETLGGEVPNEDSSLVEFDEGNLFSLSRFPGSDVYEEGLRANLGVTWTRYDPSGWSASATAGRVVRFSGADQFGAFGGLSGEYSDWLLGFQVEANNKLSLTNRSILNDDLSVDRSETRLAFNGDRTDVDATLIWVAAEPAEGRPEDSAEIGIETAYDFNRHWTGSFDWRYEADANRATFAGLGLQYENECLGMDFTVSRRFTDSTSVEPITEFGFRLFLSGFGSQPQRRAHSCR